MKKLIILNPEDSYIYESFEMEYINTCTLGLFLTPDEKSRSYLYPNISNESEMKIAICISPDGIAKEAEIRSVYQSLTRIMLEKRRTNLEEILDIVNEIVMNDIIENEAKEKEKQFQILVHRALNTIDKICKGCDDSDWQKKQNYFCLRNELCHITSYLGSQLFVSRQFDNFVNSECELSIEDVRVLLYRALREYGEILWSEKIDYDNPYNLTEIGKEIRKIDSILATIPSVSVRKDGLIEYLASFQEFSRQLPILVRPRRSEKLMD
jgi:hypothetical protein